MTFETSLAITRAMTSVAAPGPVGTISLTWRAGQSCACAPFQQATSAQAPRASRVRFMGSLPVFLISDDRDRAP